MAFKYKTHNGASLTTSQESLLDEIENHSSPFAGIQKLNDLRSLTGVSVVISDRKSLIHILTESIGAIENKTKEYKESEILSNSNVEGEIYGRLRWAKDQLRDASNSQAVKTPLLGLYTRKLTWFDNSAPVVYLFADNIAEYARRKSMDEDNVFAFVFVHEMMHAYYDAFNSEGFPCKERIEEAFAEFGMLLFLHSFGRLSLFTDARDDVVSEIKDGPREYGFGFELLNMSGKDGVRMIDRYKDISNWIDSSIVYRAFSSHGLGNFFSDFPEYDKNPDATNAAVCFKDVQDILNYSWQKPTLCPQQTVGAIGHISSSPYTTNTKGIWALTSVPTPPASSIKLHPVISSPEIVSILVGIIRILKISGFEAGLSFDGSMVKWAGINLFHYSPAPSSTDSRSIIVPESVCVNGTFVFPMYSKPILLPMETYGKVIKVLGMVIGDAVTVVKDTSGYTLYGSWKNPIIKSVFGTRSRAVVPSPGRRFDIIVRATSEVIGEQESMSRVPLVIVEHFCKYNKNVTSYQLQSLFNRDYFPLLPSPLGLVTPKPVADAYNAGVSAKGKRPIPYFFTKPINLPSGEVVLIERHWLELGGDFSAFIKVADSLGYEILEH